VHVDVVPAGELALHRPVHGRVGVLDSAECLVGEHHAEAERIVGCIALPDRDLVASAELPRERGEVQAARSATDHRDAHAASLDAADGPEAMSLLRRSSSMR
jgi:N-acetylmuramic acid 6-phosphate (MurNAc-6-P) etherase